MAGKLTFNRRYAEFDKEVRDFEKSDDVGYVVTQFLWWEGAPYYPIGALMDADIGAIWLGEDDPQSSDVIDLIFRMRPFDPASNIYEFEIVMRNGVEPFYAGYAVGSEMTVTDEVTNFHRVLVTQFDGAEFRYVFNPAIGQYQLDESLVVEGPASELAAKVRRAHKRRR